MTATSISLLAVGLLSALCYAGLWIGTGADGPTVPHFLGLTALAFMLYGVACAVARKVTERAGVPLIIGGAVIFRMLMSGPLIHDDDIYRYHWDGKVLAAGINPYRYAPDDPILSDLRDEHWQHIGYPYVKTIYPPLTELLSAGSYFVWPSPDRIRVLAALFDLATMIPILLILRRLAMPLTLVIIYAWNPLPIKEFANTGHLDSVSIFFATFALYALSARRRKKRDSHLFQSSGTGDCPSFSRVTGGILWGLSFLAKTWTLVLFPLYLTRRRAIGIVAFGAVVVLGIGPFVGAGRDILAGSRAYAEQWEFNSGLFAAEKMAFAKLGLDGRGAAKLLNALIWLVFAALMVRKRTEEPGEMLRRAALLIGTMLLLSPVCNPWYVCWLLPLLCVHRSPAWLAFTGLSMLSYAYYVGPLGHLDPAARIAEYSLLALLLAWEQVSRNPHRLWCGLLTRTRRA